MQIRAEQPESADYTPLTQSLIWSIATTGVLIICLMGWLLLMPGEHFVVFPHNLDPVEPVVGQVSR